MKQQKISLNDAQKKVIKLLRHYNCLMMLDGWCTGGHGLRIDLRTAESLRRKGIMYNGQLTELGKTINIEQ